MRILNNELASEASQSVKAGICTVIESLLMECDRYRGYQLLYWTKQGCDEWRADGRPQDDRDKYSYGIGATTPRDENIVGEYSRSYSWDRTDLFDKE